jgi:hypothetical protein
MIKQELIKRSPIRILEQTIHGGLGKGNLGVFIAKKGVGKTACLVHFATDHLLRGEKALHVSFADDPQHIASWYQQMYEEVAAAYKLEDATDIFEDSLHHRLIVHFKQPDITLDYVEKNLSVYIKYGNFKPEIIIVDGFPLQETADLAKWQQIAQQYQAEIWFSATLPTDGTTAADFIKPFADYFSVIIALSTQLDHIDFHLLKNHTVPTPEKLRLRLDPGTLLIANHRV